MTRHARWALLILGFPVVLSVAVLLRSCSDRDGHMRHVFAAVLPGAQYRTNGGMALPDPTVTPGAIDPEIEGDPSGASFVVNGIEKNICAPHFSAKAIRKSIKNFPKLKRTACDEYGVTKCDGSIEGDHLISIEIGGCADCQENIWPQPMEEARIKDHQVEDVLPKLVCGGTISLADAQKCIAGDWVKCGERIKESAMNSASSKNGTIRLDEYLLEKDPDFALLYAEWLASKNQRELRAFTGVSNPQPRPKTLRTGNIAREFRRAMRQP